MSFNVMWAIFQIYNNENEVLFWYDYYIVCYVLDHHAELDFDRAISLKPQSVGTLYPESKSFRLYSSSFILHALQQRSIS